MHSLGVIQPLLFAALKKMALGVWEVFPQVIIVSSSLSNNLSEISDTFLDKLVNFATLMYCVPNQ